ncbi:MAG: trigger factor [Deltaproteobacteria bacterium]|nr:trigger factor [Deltaproteobacteria bacterium]
MKTSIDAVSGIEKKITVEIPAEDVSLRIEEQYAEIRKEVPLKGFRKGKAPLDMVKRLFKGSVESELSERMVKESLTDVVKEKDIKILSMGDVDAGKVVPGDDFRFSVTVEVVPEVEAKDYKGLPVVREKSNVTDDEVVTAIERLRTPYARFQPEEGRKAERGDLAEFAFKATSAGEPVDENENVTIVLSNAIPFGQEFEDKMIGVGTGDERSFEIAFPATHPVPKYAGKTVAFEVKVATVRERKLPDLDDGFAKQFGIEGGMAELREKMRERLLAEAEHKTLQDVEEEIRKKLAERNVFDVPPTLIKRQTLAMIENTIEHMESSGVDLKKTKLDFDQMSERLKSSAERMVRVGLVIDAVARQENLDVAYSDIEAEMKRMAEAEGVDLETIREKYSSEEGMDSLRDRLLERKVMNFLLENAEVKEEVAE